MPHTLKSQTTVTTLQARKLLGAKYSHLSDDQVRDIVIQLTLIAREFINSTVPRM